MWESPSLQHELVNVTITERVRRASALRRTRRGQDFIATPHRQ